MSVYFTPTIINFVIIAAYVMEIVEGNRNVRIYINHSQNQLNKLINQHLGNMQYTENCWDWEMIRLSQMTILFIFLLVFI
jgi:hypothetical protein